MKKNKPHDSYFKASFSNLKLVLEFIENFFPKNILRVLNLDTLQLEDASFVDPNLDHYFSDLIYSCELKTGEKVRIVLLWEHKSYIPKFPHIQFNQYLNKHWEADIANKRDLTTILPILFYHGKVKWNYRPFHSYFKNLPLEFQSFVPNFEYFLIDLSQYSDKEILALDAELVITSLLLLKHSKEENYIKNNIKQIFSKFVKAFLKDSEPLKKLLLNAYYYIYETTKLKPKNIEQKVNQLSKKIGGYSMTTATLLRHEGKLEGRMEGRQEGRLEGKLEGKLEEKELVIKNGYAMGLTIEMLAKITILSENDVLKIIQKNAIKN